MRFVLNLLPLLQNATSLRRVVSVLAATLEGAIDTTDMAGADFPLRKRRDQASAMETLLLQIVARRAPDVSFVHGLPGLVKSGIMRDAESSWSMSAIVAISKLIAPLIAIPPAEAGERHLFLATSARYTPRQGDAAVVGVPLGGSLAVARGVDGQMGSGLYSVDHKDESASPKVEELLAKYGEDGTAQKVWDYVADDFQRITGTEVAL